MILKERKIKDFCCSNIELIEENELINSYGGNMIYRDTYVCRECNKVFYIDINDYTCEEEFIEETDEEVVERMVRK